MFFSFIVPVYNTSKYLEQCVNSLICQNGAEFEILLVDDGSTDNSGKMCDDYAQKYPDIVRVIHKENEGLLITRRRGFAQAKGDYFICVDSDDYIDKNLLSSVVDTINKYQPDMVMYNFQYFTDAGEISSSRLDMKNESVYVDEQKQKVYEYRLLTDDVNSLCCKALKRDIIDIDVDYSSCGIRNMCEDAVQVLPLFTNAQKIVYLSTPLYYYRKAHAATTSVRTYDSWMATKTCFLITEKYLDIWNVSKELRKRFYTHNLEVLSNFVRWIFLEYDCNTPELTASIIRSISESDAFSRCLKMYNKAYAQTSYLRICVPIINKYLRNNNIKGLSVFFKIEKWLLSIK